MLSQSAIASVPPVTANKLSAKPTTGRMQEAIQSRAAVPLAAAAAWMAPELSIVVPTLNENGNVPLLVLQLGRALKGIRWELIFVDDDSDDGTIATARGLARRDPRIRCLRRIGRRGLAGALIEGMLVNFRSVSDRRDPKATLATLKQFAVVSGRAGAIDTKG